MLRNARLLSLFFGAVVIFTENLFVDAGLYTSNTKYQVLTERVQKK